MADVAVGVDGGGLLDTAEQVNMSVNSYVTTPAGVSVGVTNTAVLTPTPATASAAKKPFKGRYMLVRVVESGSQVDTVLTVKAGPTDQTPANRASKGDLVLPALGASQDSLIQLELARFLQADGTVRIDVTGTAGGAATISIVNLSKSA